MVYMFESSKYVGSNLQLQPFKNLNTPSLVLDLKTVTSSWPLRWESCTVSNLYLLRLQCDLLWWPKSIQCGRTSSLGGLLHIGEVIWNMTYLPLFPSLFLHMQTTGEGKERFSELQNLHSPLFKQHLFSNDRSTLSGEWESIFNWMFTWGITSTIWIKLLDHMQFIWAPQFLK